MRLYLDDERPTPAGWERAYTAKQAEDLLLCGNVTEVSLDHDLGDDVAGTGYDVACFIERGAAEGWLPRLLWNVHSANPSGSARMRLALTSADRFWDS